LQEEIPKKQETEINGQLPASKRTKRNNMNHNAMRNRFRCEEADGRNFMNRMIRFSSRIEKIRKTQGEVSFFIYKHPE